MEGVDVFWMEQAESLQDEMTIVEPSIREPGSELFFIWNPRLRTDWCWKRFVQNAREGDISKLVNYHHNPWWGKILENQRLYYKEMEPSLYPWVWEGMPNDGDGSQQVLPYALLEVCVEMWDKRPRNPKGVCDAGFDVAEGGADKCAVVTRQGPNVLDCQLWPGVAGDLEPAAKRAHEEVRGYRLMRMYYDGAHAMQYPLLTGTEVDSRPDEVWGEGSAVRRSGGVSWNAVRRLYIERPGVQHAEHAVGGITTCQGPEHVPAEAWR